MNSTQPESTKAKLRLKPFVSKRVQFIFPERFRRFWNHDSPNLTYFFNSFSILFPTFERLFILSVLNFRRQVKKTALEGPMKTFLAQEAQHDHHIKRLNTVLEQVQGYPIHKLEENNLRLCKAINRRCSCEFQLAMTMGAEHLIAVLSDMHLRNPVWLEQAEPALAALWRWHAIEEIEHKAVAFDIYHAVHGGYWTKILAYVFVNTVIAWMWFKQWLVMAIHDGQWYRPKFWWDGFRFLFLKPAVLPKLVIPMLKYLHPKFHPWQLNNQALIADWQSYFAKHPHPDDALKKLQTTLP